MSEQKSIAVYQDRALSQRSDTESPVRQMSAFPSAEEFRAMNDIAKTIADTEFVPISLRKRPDAILACILAGREMGVGPMQALRGIHIIQGRPAPSAELMRALVLSNGHSIATTEYTDDHVTVVGRRRGQQDSMTVTFGVADAKRAQLSGKEGGNYNKYPRSMFLARATSELCRAIFPDVLAGFGYTPEETQEMEPEVIVDGVNQTTGEIIEDRPSAPPQKPAAHSKQAAPATPKPPTPVTLMDWRNWFLKGAVASGWTEADVTAVFSAMLDPAQSDAEQIDFIKDMAVNLKKGLLTRPGSEPAAEVEEVEGWDK
jgi:hypothetical protein